MFKKSFLKTIAEQEKVSLAFLERQLRLGRVVIPLNKKRRIVRPCALGQGLKVKINTNIGLSTEGSDIKTEIKKLKTALAASSDTIMDLSVGGKLKQVRKEILKNCPVPLGTVPLYEVFEEVKRRRGDLTRMTFADIWDVLKQQAEEGVDFFTIHAGILKDALTTLKRKKRVGGVVSRGGAILTRWMYVNRRQNPLYENFDKILELAKQYNITLSLGDALRPGAIADSSDRLQLAELNVLGALIKRCRRAGVQAMVEGPGHIRLDEIAANIFIQKEICQGAPFYVLGPIPTDIAAGYDHITSAIGGAIAALAGADFLCVVTPAEHLRHPSADDVKLGVIASRIAAHSVDVLRFKEEWTRDYDLSLHRARRNWQKLFPLTLDEDKARRYRKTKKTAADICTMCGELCSLKMIEQCNLLK